MPQVVDLEALVCGGGGGDGRVVCETLIDPRHPPSPPGDADLPVESFRLSVDAVAEWVERNAAASYKRGDSTKGITNPKVTVAHYHPKTHSSSQRYYAKPKGPIIGLPNKFQNSGYLGQSARRQGANCRLFPKRCGAQPAGKGKAAAVPELEPTSPKVSCFGKVVSDRDQNGNARRPPEVTRDSSSVATSVSTGDMTGFWASILGMSCCKPRREAALSGGAEEEAVSSSRIALIASNGKITSSMVSRAGARGEAVKTLLEAPTPGLGGMRRFASGRRAASWGGDLDLEVGEEDVAARSGPTSPLESGERILPGRRSVGSLAELERERDWETSGSASI